ncbi:MAG: hypothetical protein DRJ52_06290 [Thermoprotei archaeon]|nr:MAG: hypothetical protein DRJ52_06290 [Thermoprotei archaeon]RLE97690.1 MAG: hypothetical protein DRJ63_08790 [Thermoprotei archaeon]
MTVVDVVKEVVDALSEKGIDSVIVGEICLELLFKIPVEVNNFAVFSLNKSPFLEPQVFEEIGLEKGWDVGFTDIGTPYYLIRRNADEYVVEIIENIGDIYIPDKMLKNAIQLKIDKVKIKVLRLEDYIIVACRASRPEDFAFLDKIKKLKALGKIKINSKYLAKNISLFKEDENFIRRRLSEYHIL